MKSFFFFGAVFVFLFVGGAFGAGTYSGGSGTEDDPYRIATAGQLHELSLHSEDWDKCFVLTGDIDMDPNLAGNTAYTDSLIGVRVYYYESDYNIPFTGTFDGNRFSIKNLVIDAANDDYIGLFGYVDGGVIKNLGVENCLIKGHENVGGLVAYNKGTFSQCFAEGEISGYDIVGGFVGQNSGTIGECYSAGHVSALTRGGGFVGQNGKEGGIVPDGLIEDCYSKSSVALPCNSYRGGFAGRNYKYEINRCYSVGVLPDSEGCSGKGGGFLGQWGIGIGYCNGCFWDVDTSGTGYAGEYFVTAPIGLNTEMMKSMRFYSYYGWGNGLWTIDDGNDYPRLAWEGADGVPIAEYSPDMKGNGTVDEPYEIETASDLRLISSDEDFWDKHFILTNDIDLAGIFMVPIGNISHPGFTGVIDGGGHVISNLTVYDYRDAGLFGYMGSGSEVKRLGLENINISGVENVGGLAGYNSGTISECYVTGEVSVSQSFSIYCGGLIGYNDGTVRDCYSRAAVSGYEQTGGLIGMNRSPDVSRCYCAGLVSGTQQYFGGIFGNTVYLNTNNCFWDHSKYNDPMYELQFTDLTFSRKTYQMQNPAMYSFSGWGGDVWTLDVGNDYPHLAWEGVGGVTISDVAGDGSVDNPYELSTAYDLIEIRYHQDFMDKSFLLTADIDMDPNVTGIPVFYNALLGTGSHTFTGIFDGNGHMISNLEINNSGLASPRSGAALFGTISQNGIVKNLGIENISLTGCFHAGALVGSLRDGEIRNCYSTGTISAPQEVTNYPLISVGGLVGTNYGGLIRDCYSSCNITDGAYVGGIIGYNLIGGEIRNCFSTGSLTGDKAGGIVGNNREGVYSNCFWDNTVNAGLSDCGFDLVTELSDIDLDTVEGLSTDGLQNLYTFTDSGWDFVGESVNGDEDVWRLCVDGSGYPRLAWEYARVGDFVCGDGVDLYDFAYFSARDYCDGCGGIFGPSGGVVDIELLAAAAGNWLDSGCGDCGGGDVTGDGSVDMDDFGKIAGQWLCSSPVNWDRCDLDGDGVVGDSDFDIWIGYWLGE